MTLEQYVTNLLPWFVQICSLSLIGTLLPMALRIRHPRTQLAYGYALLLVCLLLPVLQPWRAPSSITSAPPSAHTAAASINVDSSASASSTSIGPRQGTIEDVASRSIPQEPSQTPDWLAGLSISRILLWVLVGGALVRLGALAIGIWQIRRYRISATPVFPIPDSIKTAFSLVPSRAIVCLSPDVTSPATLGFLRPVILLPTSFLDLEEGSQQAIVCHELLHVRRGDWLAAILEGVVSAVLWFPPMSWLLSEIRLAREQLVDAEVVRLTSSRDAYIHALLGMAGGRPRLDLLPVPLFLRRRHLTERVQALLDSADSMRRLSLCYTSAAVVLTAIGWLTIAFFPFVGIAPRVEAAEARVDVSGSPPTPATREDANAPVVPASAPARSPEARVPEPVGEDPIVGGIENASTPAERAEALALIERARQNNDLHIAGTPPFHLEATFEASGDVTHVGPGALTQTWMSGQRWRWTASLGDYSQARIGSRNAGFDESPVAAVPIRVHMLRTAIFSPVRISGNRIRVAAGRASGEQVNCVLLAAPDAPATSTRLWNETEYCIDAAGLLRVYSPALGSYTYFEYSSAHQFGGRTVPDRISSFVGGNRVLAARLRIAGAGSPDSGLFTPTEGMLAAGPGVSLVMAQWIVLRSGADPDGPRRTVVVHAGIDPAGAVLEAEVAHGDPALAPSALALVKSHRFQGRGTQRDAYVGVEFGSGAGPTP